MSTRCCVPYCKSGYVQTSGPRITSFKFPKDKARREAWVKAINRADFTPNNSTMICIKHFNKHDVKLANYHGRLVFPLKHPMVHRDAIPCIFPRRECDRTPGKRFRDEDPLETGIVAEHCEDTTLETPTEIFISALPATEPIESFENFKAQLFDTIISEFNDTIKFHQERNEIYLYKINISNFTISQYIRISNDLWGHFYRDSINLPELNQQFVTWNQFHNLLQDFFLSNRNVEDNSTTTMLEDNQNENSIGGNSDNNTVAISTNTFAKAKRKSMENLEIEKSMEN